MRGFRRVSAQVADTLFFLGLDLASSQPKTSVALLRIVSIKPLVRIARGYILFFKTKNKPCVQFQNYCFCCAC
jgi:hypothetical protein